MSSTKHRYDKIQLQQQVRVNITQDFLNKVKFFCKKINEVEWSGMVFYNIEGSIRQAESLVITPIDILLKDIGKHSTTGYEYDEDCLAFVEDNNLLDAKHGMIHSHHTMKVFFSSTDDDELHDNVANHNLYFSLIVNNYMDMDARLVFLGEPFAYNCPDENGSQYELEVSSLPKVMLMHKCNIIKPVEEIPVTEAMLKNIQEVSKKAQERTRKENEEALKKKQAAEAGAKQHQGIYDKYHGPQHLPSQQQFPGFREDISGLGYGSPVSRLANIREIEQEPDETAGEYDEFFEFCLNGGSHSNQDIMTLIEEIDETKTGDIVVDMIVKNYALYYESFFEGDVDAEEFKSVIEDFIEVCHFNGDEYEWLILLGTGLSLILSKFEQLNLNETPQR